MIRSPLFRAFTRCKHSPDHWSVLAKKNHPIDKALAHFDDFYKQVFTTNWEGIREGLLAERKYVAIVNNYGDSDETMTKFELNGALNMRRLFQVEKETLKFKKIKHQRQKKLQEIEKIDQEIDERIEKQNFSLRSDLEKSEIDEMRIVDSRNAISSEILHQFVPTTRIKGKEDFILESEHYKYYKSDFHVEIEEEYDIHFPEHLNVYCFEEGNDSYFEPSPFASTGVLNYYLMDGGSVLPVLALDLKPGNTVLDMCAAPGGKTLLSIQTLYPECVVANDVSLSRTNRIKKVADQFLYDLKEKWFDCEKLKLTNIDGRFFKHDEFDRVLVDVPCTTDRLSVMENDNNIFRPSRIKERLKLPELQCALLENALKLVKKGGIVVYSTCSLSPIQNDGVVHMALKKTWEETKNDFVVVDLSRALIQTRSVFKLASRKLMKYGNLVVPYLPQNYGPTYFCKIKRIN